MTTATRVGPRLWNYVEGEDTLHGDPDLRALYEVFSTDGQLFLRRGIFDLRQMRKASDYGNGTWHSALAGAAKITAISLGLERQFPALVSHSGNAIKLSEGIEYVPERSLAAYIARQIASGRPEVKSFFDALSAEGKAMLVRHDDPDLSTSRVHLICQPNAQRNEQFPPVFIGMLLTLATLFRSGIFPRLNSKESLVDYRCKADPNTPC